MKNLVLRSAAALIAVILLFSTAFGESGTTSVQASEGIALDVSRSVFSMTEARTVEVRADFGKEVNADQLTFQFGGKDLSEWKKWSGGTDYNGEPFIKVVEGPEYTEGSTEMTATIEFGLLYDRSDLSNRTIRTQYQQFIGDYELAVINSESGVKAATDVSLNVYDEFLFYDELKPEIDEIFEEAKSSQSNDRYLEYQKLGESVEGRDLHFVILARDEKAVDTYLNETLPEALDDPESLLEKLENGEMEDYQVPIWFNNIHPDEVEGVDAQIELLEKFALDEEVSFTNTDEEGNDIEETIQVDEVLDDAIFLYMFTNNPDGRAANTRANAEGFDLNRDNTNQTQVETQHVTEEIAKWTPLSFIDMHGYVDGFLIEPGTPPHNPNFEYDLLIGNMLNQADAMGRAGVGNSDLTSYFIPQLEWEDGWDDMTPAYTAMYAMLHGSMGHTVEVPALSQDSFDAMVGVGLGSALFVAENKDELFKDQLEIFERGVKGQDDRSVDEYLVNAEGESIGRNRNGNDNFFPEYYVIPNTEDVQKNVLEAHKMAEYLIRNGIHVEELTTKAKLNGTSYPKGTFIVPMDQAKRGLANAVLYEGDNVSDWNAMYDPIVVNFPDLRGFDVIEVREENVFKDRTREVKEVTLPDGDVKGNPPKQIVKNNTNDTVKLVNTLLREGKKVEVVLESKGKASKGDYVIQSRDLHKYADDYYFEAASVGNGKSLKTTALSQAKVAATGSAQLNFSLRQLGFELVDAEKADVIVSDSGSFTEETVEGKAFIGIGVSALNAVRNSGVLPGFNFSYTRSNHEGLVKADVTDHLITSGYEKEDYLYIATGSWITTVPEKAEVLARFGDEDDFYVSGWWPGNEGAKGQTMAFTHETESTDFTLFANELAFRGHTQYSYRLLANSIFDSVSDETKTKKPGKPKHPGKGKKHHETVGKDKMNEKVSQGKTNMQVEQNAFAQAIQSKEQLNHVVLESDWNGEGGSLEVAIPSKAVAQLKKAHKEASIELRTGKSVYLIPLEDINLKKASSLGDDFTISITVTEQDETYPEREGEDSKQNVSLISIKAVSQDKSKDLLDIKSF
ncbi:M14 family zinc carboxypeptidase [Jeotgalibacillus sp. ET6]|uniref:M14 family metallopeptidase n=1 Tax=Jeotgalibacillus sp. ET6 TaxID=3037260 RepID=UPI0024184DC5|nr:M14 family zinc carboxypeptidase [Jeotgalibacillus sp. ET6]MDG5473657.1 M14 family zinc carboxypeptidase [Jeotgalibacillus sp. ET6]